MTDKITDGMVVSLAYILTVDGQIVSQTDADDPLEYLHGAENIIPGLEAALTGKQVGDRVNVTLTPDEAYGDYDQDEIEEVDRSDMPEPLEVGMMVEVEDEDGFIFPAMIIELTDDTVTLDFNPPLAGKTLTYDVQVLGLRPANEDELDHGHPHSLDDEFGYDQYEEDDEE
jgi:FKBP-type peptidyl-prolyl cis-trans isomerase SlyD